MVTRIVVFRFDRNPLVCRARVRQLRSLNPGVVIAGLYGGPRGLRSLAVRMASRWVLCLDSLYVSRRDGRWNWQHGDLALAAWFRDVGHAQAFDVAHLVEWDLYLAAPLDQVYREVPPDAVGLTAHTPLRELAADWEWMTRDDLRQESDALLEALRERFGFRGEPHACLGIGPCFPRAFLAAYAELGMPALANDEMRLPQAAQLLGFAVADTCLRRSWHSVEEDLVFNATGRPIERDVIRAEVLRPEGRRAFHPVRERDPMTG